MIRQTPVRRPSTSFQRLISASLTLAGLAAAERERVGLLIKRLSCELPILLVKHDIDRVVELADAVTVMNDGKVLLDGGVEDARGSKRDQEIYIGSGTAALAGREIAAAATPESLLGLRGLVSNVHFARNWFFAN